MTIPEIHSESAQRVSQPGIIIYRRVLDIPTDYHEALSERLEAAGFTRNLVKVTLDAQPKAVIISDGEIRRLQTLIGINPNETENEELANYLNNEVPDSYDDPIENLHVFPLKYFKRQSKTDALVVSIATKNPAIENERKLTQEAINKKYGIKRKRVSGELAWLNYNYRTTVNIAFINNNKLNRSSTIPKIKKILEKELSYSLPEEISLDWATIDDKKPELRS